MSLPDGAEYWWDIKGHSYATKSRAPRTPEQKAAQTARRKAREACLCVRCGHTFGQHGRLRLPVKNGKRRHGGQCNHARTGDRLGCACSHFVPKPEDVETLGSSLLTPGR